ncbi:olfactory receptor 11L1-like [Hyperolius riggenbachi]|uniref:olfactory receptor 11L1-like n=1 Tax=Hyperolius riggenbachi TaxID=752182 RepID=UPI0035A2DE38
MQNNVSTILFLGFNNISNFNLLPFILLILIYCVTLGGNLLIITLVSNSKSLHSPMYFFLTQLSVADIILTTDIAPTMLDVALHGRASISFSGCITQYFFFSLSEASECFLLTAMSYDRYLAICSPLHYVSIMDQQLCIKLITAAWFLGCFLELIVTFTICQLLFCGPNIIDHFLCDFYPLVELSCSDLTIIQIEATLLCFPVIVVPFLMVVVSYVYIVFTISKISSFSGRLKSFSTCSSHLTVVFIFYGTLIAMYLVPNEGQSKVIKKMFAMLYTVLTPLINPFIYSLRNKDIKKALKNGYNHSL